VQGPALSVRDKDYQAGDRIVCLTNDRHAGVRNGTRGVVTSVDPERGTLTLERPDHGQVTIDTRQYDALDRGYALTVHKAQGMTADIAMVVGFGWRQPRVDLYGDVEGHPRHAPLRSGDAA